MNKADSRGFFEIESSPGGANLKSTQKFKDFMVFLKWNQYLPLNGNIAELSKDSLDRYYEEFMKSRVEG